MTQRNTAEIPDGLPGEYALLWAIIRRAQLDAAYTRRPGVHQPDVLPEERQDAIEFLHDVLDGLRPVCA